MSNSRIKTHSLVTHHIVQNIQGKKLSQLNHLMSMCGKPFAFALKITFLKYLWKNICGSRKTAKAANVLSLKCFVIYSIYLLIHIGDFKGGLGGTIRGPLEKIKQWKS